MSIGKCCLYWPSWHVGMHAHTHTVSHPVLQGYIYTFVSVDVMRQTSLGLVTNGWKRAIMDNREEREGDIKE